MKPRHLALSLLFACLLACGGAATDGADAPKDAVIPEPKDGIVVVPVEDDGQEHFCCEYTEDGKQKFALLPNPRACRARFADRGARWVEGPQCLPCCCEQQLSPTDPSQGVKHELTVPGECAGVGQCVSSTVPECFQENPGAGDDDDDRGKIGKGKGKPPVPDRGREVIAPKDRDGRSGN